ncbi:MAG: hypothetical protein M1828_000441 [Chrysothrix sp. TS-e1954]|nr:MAG: hypothetical protein M1828_000441 [Chrysothrix sp. TS-e1954]
MANTLPNLASSPSSGSTAAASANAPANEDVSPREGAEITGKWTIPARPKPGRKPSIHTPPSRRKAQNREAQRAFRERRAAREDDLKKHFSKEEQQWNVEKQQLLNEIAVERQALHAEVNKWRQVASEAVGARNVAVENLHRGMEQLKIRSSIGSEDSSLSSSTVQPHARDQHDTDTVMEMDFTTLDQTAPSKSINVESLGGELCGFCTNDDNCVCAERKAKNENMQLEPPTENKSEARLGPVQQKLPIMEPTGRPAGPSIEMPRVLPGSCNDCQQDPERRRFCQSIGPKQARFETESPSLGSRRFSGEDRPKARSSVLPHPIDTNPTMTCSETFNYFSSSIPDFGHKQDSFSMLRDLKTHPADPNRVTGSSSARKATAYEVDCASVLTAMAKSGGDFSPHEGRQHT